MLEVYINITAHVIELWLNYTLGIIKTQCQNKQRIIQIIQLQIYIWRNLTATFPCTLTFNAREQLQRWCLGCEKGNNNSDPSGECGFYWIRDDVYVDGGLGQHRDPTLFFNVFSRTFPGPFQDLSSFHIIMEVWSGHCTNTNLHPPNALKSGLLYMTYTEPHHQPEVRFKSNWLVSTCGALSQL